MPPIPKSPPPSVRTPAPAEKQPPPQKPVAPQAPGSRRDQDRFEGPLAKGLVEGMKQGMRDSLGPGVKVPMGAEEALKKVLPYLGPKERDALIDQLTSDWFKKLPPAEQEKNFKSLLNDVTPQYAKEKERRAEQLRRFR